MSDDVKPGQNCSQSCCEDIHDCDWLGPYVARPDQFPHPTEEMLEDPLFNAIWQRIKRWDIGVPEWGAGGHTGAMGNHARAILDAIKPSLTAPSSDGAGEWRDMRDLLAAICRVAGAETNDANWLQRHTDRERMDAYGQTLDAIVDATSPYANTFHRELFGTDYTAEPSEAEVKAARGHLRFIASTAKETIKPVPDGAGEIAAGVIHVGMTEWSGPSFGRSDAEQVERAIKYAVLADRALRPTLTKEDRELIAHVRADAAVGFDPFTITRRNARALCDLAERLSGPWIERISHIDAQAIRCATTRPLPAIAEGLKAALAVLADRALRPTLTKEDRELIDGVRERVAKFRKKLRKKLGTSSFGSDRLALCDLAERLSGEKPTTVQQEPKP